MRKKSGSQTAPSLDADVDYRTALEKLRQVQTDLAPLRTAEGKLVAEIRGRETAKDGPLPEDQLDDLEKVRRQIARAAQTESRQQSAVDAARKQAVERLLAATRDDERALVKRFVNALAELWVVQGDVSAYHALLASSGVSHRIEGFRALVERRHNARGELVTVSEATTKVDVDGEIIMSAGEGNGPVNALDNALRKNLGKYTGHLEGLELVDFKVRILTQEGTGAVTRVMLETMDETGERWSTVGVSPNIVDAAFEALLDSFTYKLYRDGAPPGAF